MEEEYLWYILETQEAQQEQIDNLAAVQTELMEVIAVNQTDIIRTGEEQTQTLTIAGGLILGAIIALAVIKELTKW